MFMMGISLLVAYLYIEPAPRHRGVYKDFILTEYLDVSTVSLLCSLKKTVYKKIAPGAL